MIFPRDQERVNAGHLSPVPGDRMLSSMVSRFFALAVAVCIGLTGILPAGDGARCVAMDKRITPGDDCCPKCDIVPESDIGTACFNVLHSATPQERATSY